MLIAVLVFAESYSGSGHPAGTDSRFSRRQADSDPARACREIGHLLTLIAALVRLLFSKTAAKHGLACN